MKYLFALLMIAFTLSGNAQIVSKAENLRKAGKLDEAIVEYEKKVKKAPNEKQLLLDFATTLALNNQVDSAFENLEKAVEKDSSVQFLSNPDFYYLSLDERWSTFENEAVERVEAKFGKYEYPEISKELWRMNIREGAFDYQIEIEEKKEISDTAAIAVFRDLKTKMHLENLARLEEIIAEQGFPKLSVYFGNGTKAAFAVLGNADVETRKKYLPMIKEAAEAKEADWKSTAIFIDRINLDDGKEQIYGTQIYKRKDGSFYVKNLADPASVTERRKAIGLSTMESFAGLYGIKWGTESKE